MSDKEYYNYVDEALVLFGGGAPCANIDARLWSDFKESYKEFNDAVPKTVNWSYDACVEWLDAYNESKKESEKNK
jgi:hypothetical protein